MLAGWPAGVLWIWSSRRRRGRCKGRHTGAIAVHHNRRGASAGVRADSQDAGVRRSPPYPVNFKHSPSWVRCKGHTLPETHLATVTQLLAPCILQRKAFVYPESCCIPMKFCCGNICSTDCLAFRCVCC